MDQKDHEPSIVSTRINWRHTAQEILETMDKYGGSFVRQLALLYRLADYENRKKLADAFQNYFVQYDEMIDAQLQNRR